MPELMDKVQTVKISFPGIFDNTKRVAAMPPVPEVAEPAALPAKKTKVTEVAEAGTRKLKLGKTKG